MTLRVGESLKVLRKAVERLGVLQALLKHLVHRAACADARTAPGVHRTAQHRAAPHAAAELPCNAKPASEQLLLPRAVA